MLEAFPIYYYLKTEVEVMKKRLLYIWNHLEEGLIIFFFYLNAFNGIYSDS